MPKSKIINDVIEDVVPLDKSLLRLMVISKEVKNIRLETWAKDEINGYDNNDDLPDYRKMISYNFKYSGINGGYQISNVALDVGFIDDEHLEKIKDVREMGSISSVLELSEGEKDLYRDVSYLGRDIYNSSEEMISCTSVVQVIPKAFYVGIITKVKVMLITALCELEEKYGNLDNLDINQSKRFVQIDSKNKEINKVVFNISIPEKPEKTNDKWYSKVAWNIIIPIITCVVAGIIATIAINYFGL